MAAPPSTCTVEEQRSAIRFLLSEGVKQYLQGQKFADDDEVMEAVQSWLKATSKSFFLEGIRKVVDRWNECVAKQGDYVEK